jgi:putative phosphoribosyl transferase
VTDHGVVVWDNTELGFTSPHWRTMHINQKKTAAKRQRELYLGNREPLSLVGKTVVIVDDGAATGITLLAAIKAAKLKHPSRIVVGVPVTSRDTIEKVIEKVDELVVLHVPGEDFKTVSDYYDHFPQTTDQAVIQAIKACSEVSHG